MVLLHALSLLAASAGLVVADGLNARAQADAGKKYFGTEVSSTVLGDSAANAIAKNFEDFGQYTCENVCAPAVEVWRSVSEAVSK
jgi:endo-1,4-beta-xylanase